MRFPKQEVTILGAWDVQTGSGITDLQAIGTSEKMPSHSFSIAVAMQFEAENTSCTLERLAPSVTSTYSRKVLSH